MGSRGDVDVQRDHWTVVTKDGLPSVHMEHTFAITQDGVLVLTADEDPAPIIRAGELVLATS